MGLTGGGVGATNAAFVAEFYGMENFAMNLSIVNMRSLLASLFSSASGALFMTYGTYIPVYYMMMVMAAGALVLGLCIRKP